jgi:DNA processing protein
MLNDKSYLLALGLTPGVGSILARQLISYFGSAKAVFEAPKGRLSKVQGIGETLSAEIVKKQMLAKAEKLLKECEQKQVQLLTQYDTDYPTNLKEAPDSPLFVFWQGNANPLFQKSVAIIGTRQCTQYGREITEKLVEDLIPYRPVVVSGFAHGIDIVAHKAAMAKGLCTIAVLGGGVDKIYPAEHAKYVPQMIENGAMVSEFPFGMAPVPGNFPARNRIVAGMVDAVIVMESAMKGGSLITAEIANSYNRDVFAVPGNIGNKYSEGCHMLIREHKAAIFTDVKSMALALNWEGEFQPKPKLKIDTSQFSAPQALVFQLLADVGEMNIDDIAWKAKINMNQLASILLEMELQGWIKPLPGKKFKVA